MHSIQHCYLIALFLHVLACLQMRRGFCTIVLHFFLSEPGPYMLIHLGEASSIFKQKCPKLSTFYTNFKQNTIYLLVGRYEKINWTRTTTVAEKSVFNFSSRNSPTLTYFPPPSPNHAVMLPLVFANPLLQWGDDSTILHNYNSSWKTFKVTPHHTLQAAYLQSV